MEKLLKNKLSAIKDYFGGFNKRGVFMKTKMRKYLFLITVFLTLSNWVGAETNVDIQFGMAHLSTKEDYLYIKKHFPPEVWRPKFQALLDERMQWLSMGKLEETQASKIDETHKVIELKDEVTGKVKERYQYKFQEDPNCKLFRLGFTVEEIKSITK